MDRKLFLGWIFLVSLLVLGTVKCGKEHSVSQEGISNHLAGMMEVESLNVPQGTTQVIEKDLVVFASKDIQVDGALDVKEGVNLVLLARGHLTINGKILGTHSNNKVSFLSLSSILLPEAFAGDSSDWVLCGDQVFISSNSTITAPQGVNVSISTHDKNGKITIKGTIKTPEGRDAQNRNESGQNAGLIEIGTLSAGNKAEMLAEKFGKKINTDSPARVTVTGTLDAGSGGNGFSDEVGVDNGFGLDLRGTNGGNGGSINIHSTAIEVSGENINAGDGGNGGSAGKAPYTHAVDGKRDGEKGHDLTFLTGRGGKGGNIDLLVSAGGTENRLYEGKLGKGGSAGSVFASAGNGGPWGKGGDMNGTVELPGENGGYGSQGDGTLFVVKPNAFFKNGGNGGDSNNPKRIGGGGGHIDITGPGGKLALLNDPMEISNYGNGGKGFNGCAVTPRAPGTDGGDAYQSGVYSLAVRQAKYSLDKHSFWGGDGGDGTTYAGYGGIQGQDDRPGRIGDWGKSGKKCPVQTASVIQDGPQPIVVSLPPDKVKPTVVSLRPPKSPLLVQSAPPSTGQTMLVLQQPPESHEPDLPSDGIVQQFVPSTGFPVYHPVDRAQVEEEIRSIPGRFDPRAFGNF
jgi:hypothetical protein